MSSLSPPQKKILKFLVYWSKRWEIVSSNLSFTFINSSFWMIDFSPTDDVDERRYRMQNSMMMNNVVRIEICWLNIFQNFRGKRKKKQQILSKNFIARKNQSEKLSDSSDDSESWWDSLMSWNILNLWLSQLLSRHFCLSCSLRWRWWWCCWTDDLTERKIFPLLT